MAQLYFHYASMNAGKSLALLSHANNYKERGMGTLVMKPSIDSRDSSTEIVSRIGLKQEANIITPGMDLLEFFKCPVMCYGLRTDFRGELFEGSKALLAAADKLVELKGVCHCGRKATMVARVREDGSAITEGAQVELGGEDRYISLCRKHWCELVGIE